MQTESPPAKPSPTAVLVTAVSPPTLDRFSMAYMVVWLQLKQAGRFFHTSEVCASPLAKEASV